jgi:hypothetical protein
MSADPLNPFLYKLLVKKFGSVRISSEGCSAHYQRIPDPFHPNRTIFHAAFWGEYYCVRCPFCRDHKHRLWINHLYASEVTNGRREFTHLAVCYNNNCMKEPGRKEQLEQLIFSVGAHMRVYALPVKPVTAPMEIKPIVPPGTVVPLKDLPEEHPARAYVIKRGFDPITLSDKFNVGLCVDTQNDASPLCRGRLYIPAMFRGELVGWQCRAIDDSKPKYLNAPNMRKSTLLYNYDQAKDQPFVIIVEGVPSVWRLGAAAVCLFGKSMSKTQHDLIVRTWATKPVFLLLDKDAAPELEQTAALLQQSLMRVIPVILPDDRDPADYAFGDITELLLDCAAAEGVLSSMI